MSTSAGIRAETPGARRGIWDWPSRIWWFVRRWPVIPGIALFGLLFIAIFAPLIAPYDPVKQHLRDTLAHPVWDQEWYEANPKVQTHILGADRYGRDVLSRVMYGARISLLLAFISLISGMILGVWAGMIAGYYGGLIDELIARFVDIWHSIPFLLLALVVSVTIGQGIVVMIGLLIALTWVGMVRNIRAEVYTLKARDYVALAKVAGASDFRILLRHVLPGVLNLLLVMASARVGGLILTEASLSFLGVGIPSHIPTWGIMINDGRETLSVAWWASVFPGLGIFLTVMSLNFLGDWVRDRTDPRLRQLD